jgi:hypothetical protein
VSTQGLLFIDATQYLDLYVMDSGKRLLAALDEQRAYIFVTAQIVDEVQRRKLNVVKLFLGQQELQLKSISVVPDHLLGSTEAKVAEIRKQLQGISGSVKDAKQKLGQISAELLTSVSNSADEVSKALTAIFSQAVKHSDDELQRARSRKELGNPPGKNNGPLGDQLSWEQLLSRCKETKLPLWIISKDSDYVTKHDGQLFLNAALYQELAHLYQTEPKIYCFDNLLKGLEHFAATAKVKADKLPTPEETEKIKKEQESLPPLGWLVNDDSGYQPSRFFHHQQFDSWLSAALRNQLTHGADIVIGPPVKDENKS